MQRSENRYNQVPHLTQDTYGKVRKTQENITYKSPFPAGDHKLGTDKTG